MGICIANNASSRGGHCDCGFGFHLAKVPVRIAILGRPDSWYARDLSRAMMAQGHVPCLVPFERLAASVGISRLPGISGTELDLTSCEAVVVRTMPPGSLEQVVFRMDVLVQLQTRGIAVLNPPKSIECAVDKYLTTARLAAAGLPVPETVVCETAAYAMDVFDDLGRDVVVKPVFGSEGRGIVRVSDPDLALRTFRTIERTQSILYLQRYIDHPGCDVRVMVLNGRVLGGMERCCPDDFRVNVSRSGQARQIELTDEQANWAVRAAEAVGTTVAGIDLLTDREGRSYVIEVNGVPGWQAFRRVTGVDVAAEIVACLENQLASGP